MHLQTLHGAVLHPGIAQPEVEPDEDFTRAGENGEVRMRRWNAVHFEEFPTTVLDVLRVDDPTLRSTPAGGHHRPRAANRGV